MTSDNLIRQVSDLSSRAADRLPVDDVPRVEAIAARLADPLRLAVAGRVKAGKSTLVNALLGQRVAPTEVSECTRVVTWFRYGASQRAQVRLRDGTAREVEFGPDGLLPAELGAPLAEVDAIDVWLSNRTLLDLIIVDTPGLASATTELSDRTEALLGVDADAASASATAEAEAVVFVTNQTIQGDEAEMLSLFQGVGGGATRSRAAAIGVLTKADLVGGGRDDPLGRAREVADRQASVLADRLMDVVPVVGLLAETVRAGSFTEGLAHLLAELAPVEDRTLLLMSAARFVSGPGTVSRADRERLLERLGLFGIARALDAIDAGTTGAVALGRDLATLSGIDVVIDVIDRRLRRPAPILKAERALRDLDELGVSAGGEEGDWLRGEVERSRKLLVHRREVLDVEDALATGSTHFPADLEEEARRLISEDTAAARLGLPPSATTGELAAAALAVHATWRGRANIAVDPEAAYLAGVVARTAHLLHRSLQEQPA